LLPGAGLAWLFTALLSGLVRLLVPLLTCAVRLALGALLGLGIVLRISIPFAGRGGLLFTPFAITVLSSFGVFGVRPFSVGFFSGVGLALRLLGSVGLALTLSRAAASVRSVSPLSGTLQ